MRIKISATVLLTIAVTLLNLGVNFFQTEQNLNGIVCVICGVALIACTIVIIEKGATEKLRGALR